MLNRSAPLARRVASLLPHLAALALLTAFLATRNGDLHPQVFSDEYVYSRGARLQPLSAAGIPNFLFFALFGATSACGDAFLDCARALNLMLFIGSSPFIYRVARRVASPHLSGFVTLLALAAPTNVYTAFFMPEATYWLVFWVTTWLAVRAAERPRTARWAVVGVAVGVLALVKPHGLFVAPALAAYAALGGAGHERRGKAAAFLAVTGVAVATKLVGGFVFAGPAGLTLFGSSYGGMASTGLDGPRVADTVSASVRLLAMHGCALVLLFALPLGAGAVALASPRARDDGPLRSLALLTLCLMTVLVTMAAVFTATVAGQGPYENALRVHARYYSFGLPLLSMLAASQVERPTARLRARLLAAALLGSAIVVAVTVGLDDLDLHLIDGPEVFTAAAHVATRRLVGLFALLVLVAWCAKPRAGAIAFLLLMTPWLAWRGNREAMNLLDGHRANTVFDRAGAAARDVAPAGEAVRVATNDTRGAYRAMFRLDRPDSSFVLLEPGETARMTSIDEGQWLLVVPARPVEGTATVTRRFDGFVLLRR